MRGWGLLAGLLLSFWATLSWALESVEIQAERLEIQGNSYRAEGDVRLRYQDWELVAQRLQLNAITGTVTAEGEVELRRGADLLRASQIQWNLRTLQGRIARGYVFLGEDHIHILGEAIVQEGPDRYRIGRARITTCDGEPPCWSLQGVGIRVQRDHYLTARHVRFSLWRIPVLYVPWILLPIQQTRQTGFLIPRISHNSEEGWKVNTAFFWAISRSRDLTLYGDYYSRKGWAGGLEYRWAGLRRSGGTLFGYYLLDRQQQRGRGWIRAHSRWASPDRSDLRLRIQYVTDRTLFREISEATNLRVLRSQDSDLFWQQRWDAAITHLWFQATQNLGGSQEGIFQRLPEWRLQVTQAPLDPLPLYWDLESRLGRWQSSSTTVTRWWLEPALQGHFSLGPLGWTPRVSLARVVYLDGVPGGAVQRTLPRLETWLHLGVTGIRGRPGAGHWIHRMVGEVRYRWQRPQGAAPGDIRLDPLDLEGATHRLRWIWRHRWVRIPGGDESPWELARLRVEGAYALSPWDRFVQRREERLLPLRVEGTFQPMPHWVLDGDGRYRWEVHRWDPVWADLGWEGPRSGLRVGYRLQKEPLVRFATLQARLESGRWRWTAQGWWDVETREIREARSAFRIGFQCWGVTVSYQYRPEEQQWSVQVDLRGMGSLGRPPSNPSPGWSQWPPLSGRAD